MTTYVIRNGELVEKHLASPNDTGNTAPHVISDTMPDTRHMASGRYFSSKAAFRAETKAYGCREVGTDQSVLRPRKPVPLDPGKRRDDIRKTIYDLRNGNR
jgi:hypothetical protein